MPATPHCTATLHHSATTSTTTTTLHTTAPLFSHNGNHHRTVPIPVAAVVETRHCLVSTEMGTETKTGTIATNIKGVFDSPNEKFSPGKHNVLFAFTQGALLRKELGNVEVLITGVADIQIYIAQVTDVKTGSVNDLLTPSRNLRISGSKLKIAGENENCGVYFINQETQARAKVDASDIVNNNPSELIIVTPALPPGSYGLEIATQFSTGGKQLLKEPRTTVFDKTLTVEVSQ